MQKKRNRGATLIEVVFGVGLIFMLFGGLFLFYRSVVDVLSNTDLRTMGTAILNKEMETIRNLPFDQVGTQGGIPSGALSSVKIVTTTIGRVFSVKTTIRNIDDPFDSILGGTPNDTAPADYKLVELEATCTTCPLFVPLILTARVAPKNLESGTNSGSLFINVFDSYGHALPGASVHVVNTSTVPSIDLTDTTNQSGILQLVGVPTSTNGYQITATKPGYTTSKTYPLGDPTNPSPKLAHMTVEAQKVTPASFKIDVLATLAIRTADVICGGVGNQPYSFYSSTLIGENPDVLKFSTSSQTGVNGSKSYFDIEWGTYTFIYSGAQDLLGTLPLSPYGIDPASSSTFTFVLQPADPNSLLVTVKNGATSAPLADSIVRIWKTGLSRTLTTGHYTTTHTDWSGGSYTDKSGMDTENIPGSITMQSVGGFYSTTSVAWLISSTVDFGTASTTFYMLNWDPVSQPVSTGFESARFQLAANSDNATWNFTGPGGDPNTYYTSSSVAVDPSLNGKRYLRYKVFLSTQDETVTPQINSISMDVSTPCVPSGQVLFTNVPNGTYTIDVTAPGYSFATSSISISGAWQQADVNLNP